MINKAIAKNAFRFLAHFEGVSMIFTEMLLKFRTSYYSFFLKNTELFGFLMTFT